MVQATNSIHDPWVHSLFGHLLVGDLLRLRRGPSNWPTTLRLEIIEAGMSTLDIQGWIQRRKAPIARVQCPPGTNNHHFGELITTLRKGKCVSRHVPPPSKLVSHASAGRNCAVGN